MPEGAGRRCGPHAPSPPSALLLQAGRPAGCGRRPPSALTTLDEGVRVGVVGDVWGRSWEEEEVGAVRRREVEDVKGKEVGDEEGRFGEGLSEGVMQYEMMNQDLVKDCRRI